MPSLFIENDWKCHFSINVDTGLWQDFKSGKTGNFASFVSLVENIPYSKAEAKILFEDFLNDGYTKLEIKEFIPRKEDINLVPVNVSSYDDSNPIVRTAWSFLFGRKLFNLVEEEVDSYYVCLEGKYKNRLIIPYKDKDNNLFYFQARSLFNSTKPKYLNPSSEGSVKPSSLLYPFDEGCLVVVCEGPLDALTLRLQGINATATTGCRLSSHQADILKDFNGKIILGFDNDEAGRRGIKKFDELRKLKRMEDFWVCYPPPQYNDWNEAHMDNFDLKTWVDKKTIKLTSFYKLEKSASSL